MDCRWRGIFKWPDSHMSGRHVGSQLRTDSTRTARVQAQALISARHASRHTLSGLRGVGQVFLAGVRPDSPSRSDTFLLLLVAARPRRGSRRGSYVGRQAQKPAIRASFKGSSGSAAMHNRDGYALRQAPQRAKRRHCLGLHRGNHVVRRLDSTTTQEGDRASTSGVEMG